MARRRWLIGTLVAAVVAFGLGVVGLAQYLPAPHRPSDVVYYALQLFVLGSDPLDEGGPFPVSLEVARLLAPATTVFALVEALRALWREQRVRRRVARRRGHTVVCGDDAVSRALAGNLRAAGTSVVRIAPGTGPTTAERGGVAVVRGDAREIATLKAAGVPGSSVVYACAAGSGDTAAVALAAARTAVRRRAQRLSVFAQVADDHVVEALRVRQMGASRAPGAFVDFFSINDIAARVLVATGELAGARDLAVVGSGTFGPALLRALVRMPPDEGCSRSVAVHTDASGVVEEFVDRFRPGTRGTVLRRMRADDPVTAHVAVVCHRDDEATLGTALRLQRSPNRQVVACLRRADPFAEALAGTDRLMIFGILDAACRPKAIEDDAVLGRAARAIHRRYVETCRAAGDTPESNPSMRDWEDLPPYLRESNYAQAEHIGAKLAELPAVLTISPPAQPFAFTGEEVLRLAKLEHKRWMQERQLAGFSWGPVRDDQHHPDLVDWPNLADESRRKDIETVRQLPDLLSSAGLHIMRVR